MTYRIVGHVNHVFLVVHAFTNVSDAPSRANAFTFQLESVTTTRLEYAVDTTAEADEGVCGAGRQTEIVSSKVSYEYEGFFTTPSRR